MAIAAKIPMIATTIINSMRVKPCCTFLNILTPVECTNQSRIEQRPMPVIGRKQAVCQCSVFAPKRMKLHTFSGRRRARLDIESSVSGAAAGAQGQRVTFFVTDPRKFLDSESLQRSDELFVMAPALH